MNKLTKDNLVFKAIRKFTPEFIMDIYKLNTHRSLFLHFLDKMTCYVFYFLNTPRKETIKVVIFAQGRTGSTLLESLICSTGYFKKGGERFKELGAKIKYPYKYITGYSNRLFAKRVIFHLKFKHLEIERTEKIDSVDFLNQLHEDGWKIIYLKRTNKFYHALSILIAKKRGSSHKRDKEKESIRIKIDPNLLIDLINERLANDKHELQILSKLNYLPIVYEEDLENSEFHQRTIDKIMDYLGLEKRATSTNLRKINTYKLQNLIENYDEVVDALKRNNFLKYINQV